jgi:two-component system phosphate regulon response regulator PhoB
MLATDTNKQILIVDRDVAAVEPLRQKLGESGFIVRAIADRYSAASAVTDWPPHLLIIEWNAPGFGSPDMIKQFRKSCGSHMVRMIILSDLSGEEYVVNGLNLGADDYIVKPYSLREAVARVCVLLRSRHQRVRPLPLACDDLLLDTTANRVTVGGKIMNLRGVEYRLLEFLMTNRGRTFNRTQLLNRVWGGDSEVDERTVDVNVQRLRKILSKPGYDSYIQTVRGFGYRFSPPSSTE